MGFCATFSWRRNFLRAKHRHRATHLGDAQGCMKRGEGGGLKAGGGGGGWLGPPPLRVPLWSPPKAGRKF